MAIKKGARAKGSGPDFRALAQRFDGPGVTAIVLMGSYARGEPGAYSDIDLVRLLDGQATPSGIGSHLVDGRLVTVSDAGPSQVEEWFTRPEVAVNVIAGVRSAQPLIDRDGAFSGVQLRARAFAWDSGMQERANAWASQQMVGWIEEVHKGLEGLHTADIGRLLHARFGCSWGLSRVMQVQRGVLVSGENAFYEEVATAIGPTSEWVRLRQVAFGIDESGRRPPSLRAQVTAGLWLYVATAELLRDVLRPVDVPVIAQTVAQIREALDIRPAARITEPPGEIAEEPGPPPAGHVEEAVDTPPPAQVEEPATELTPRSEEVPAMEPPGQPGEEPREQASAQIEEASGTELPVQVDEAPETEPLAPVEEEPEAQPSAQAEEAADTPPAGLVEGTPSAELPADVDEAVDVQPSAQAEALHATELLAETEPRAETEGEPEAQPSAQAEDEPGAPPPGEVAQVPGAGPSEPTTPPPAQIEDEPDTPPPGEAAEEPAAEPSDQITPPPGE